MKKDWRNTLASLRGPDSRLLRDGIRALSEAQVKPHPLALSEQPFDSHLLTASALFRTSRSLYLKNRGRYLATLVTSPRTLSSPVLLEQRIEYTPLEKELSWSAAQKNEKPERLLELRTYCTNLFHEQNHRVLWKFLPPPPKDEKAAGRYLNYAESLIVALDMALGDELSHPVARIFYLSGVNYDPGTEIRKTLRTSRNYRNYLHACAYATYLKLEFYEEADIRKATSRLYPQKPEILKRAIDRALRLDDDFVQLTNPGWQKKHLTQMIRAMGKLSSKALVLPEDPLQNHSHYLWTERWFELFGL
jgi:hypothetical protein